MNIRMSIIKLDFRIVKRKMEVKKQRVEGMIPS